MRQLAVPNDYRLQVLESYHDGGSHPGFERSYHAIRLKYYWPGMQSDIYKHIQSCMACQQAKRHFHAHPAPLHPLPLEETFHRWHIDVCGPLTITPRKNKYLLVIVDSFSKWMEAFPMQTQEANEIADILFSQVFTRFGAPVELCSDRGKAFMGKLVAALCALFDVKKVNTSSYHPQCDGLCERHIGSISQAIRTSIKTDQSNWDTLLPGILMAHRATPATQSSKLSPYFVVFGREMKLPIDVALTPKPSVGKNNRRYLAEVLENIDLARQIASQNMKQAQENYKQQYDKRAKDPNFELGDKVLLHCPKVPLGLKKRFHRQWTGPYYITQCKPNHTYQLREQGTDKLMGSLVHANRLKLYYTPDQRSLKDPQRDGLLDNGASQLANNAGLSQQSQTSASQNEINAHNSQQQAIDASQRIDRTQPRPSQNTWHSVRKILACKRKGRNVEYKVQWDSDGSISWIPGKDLSDTAKQQYHVSRTRDGRKRKRPLTRFFNTKQ